MLKSVLKFPILLLVVWFQMHSDIWGPVFIFQQVRLVQAYQQSRYNLYVFPVRSFTWTCARFVDFIFCFSCDDFYLFILQTVAVKWICSDHQWKLEVSYHLSFLQTHAHAHTHTHTHCLLNPEKIWHEHLDCQGKVATSDRWGRQVCKIFVSNFLRISLAKNH